MKSNDEEETFGRAFRRGLETCAERVVLVEVEIVRKLAWAVELSLRSEVMIFESSRLGQLSERFMIRFVTCVAVVVSIVLETSAAHAQVKPTEKATSKSAAARLVIVAPKNLCGSLRKYVEFKSKHRPTTLVELETSLATAVGVDDPEKLKRFLFDRWKNADSTFGYVLLVGDADVMPVRYMTLDRVTPAAFDYSFYPSDLYYADLADGSGKFEDWNGNKEGFHKNYFGEVRGEKNKTDPINYDKIHFLPEVSVGRWPASNAASVDRIVAKSISYENKVRESEQLEHPKAAFLCVGGWVDCRDQLDHFAASLPNSWQTEKRYYSDSRRKETQLPSKENVVGLINSGLGLLIHTGHGHDNGWHECIDVRSFAKMKNAAHLPIVISIGCSTARFATLPPYEAYEDIHGVAHIGTDKGEVFHEPPPPPAVYQKGKFNPSGLGEKMMRDIDGGAVVYIGCNTGSQPCALTLAEGFTAAMHDRIAPTVGELWSAAIVHYFQTQRLDTIKPDKGWYPPSIFFQPMKFMMFGDPSLPMPHA